MSASRSLKPFQMGYVMKNKHNVVVSTRGGTSLESVVGIALVALAGLGGFNALGHGFSRAIGDGAEGAPTSVTPAPMVTSRQAALISVGMVDELSGVAARSAKSLRTVGRELPAVMPATGGGELTAFDARLLDGAIRESVLPVLSRGLESVLSSAELQDANPFKVSLFLDDAGIRGMSSSAQFHDSGMRVALSGSIDVGAPQRMLFSGKRSDRVFGRALQRNEEEAFRALQALGRSLPARPRNGESSRSIQFEYRRQYTRDFELVAANLTDVQRRPINSFTAGELRNPTGAPAPLLSRDVTELVRVESLMRGVIGATQRIVIADLKEKGQPALAKAANEVTDVTVVISPSTRPGETQEARIEAVTADGSEVFTSYIGERTRGIITALGGLTGSDRLMFLKKMEGVQTAARTIFPFGLKVGSPDLGVEAFTYTFKRSGPGYVLESLTADRGAGRLDVLFDAKAN